MFSPDINLVGVKLRQKSQNFEKLFYDIKEIYFTEIHMLENCCKIVHNNYCHFECLIICKRFENDIMNSST